MEQVIQFAQQNWDDIFALVTGVLFLIFEVKQKNLMWIICIFSSSVTAYVFFTEKLYAQMALNLYYLFTAFWGIWSWARDSRKLKAPVSSSGKSAPTVHLTRLTNKVILISVISFIVVAPVVWRILVWLGDANPIMDAIVFTISIIATIWLVKSYLQQWLAWMVGDIVLTAMCIVQGMPVMAALYIFYTLSAIYGYFHWKKRGVYV